MKTPTSQELCRRRGLLVLGMHRSGTSALGRVLNLLGAELPSHTIGPDEFNEAGYREAAELYRLHDQMLAGADSRWDDWRPFTRASLDPHGLVGIEHALLEFLTAEFRDSSLFVIKDPRICRFVPLWLEVFGRFSTVPGAIILVRHPFAVAHSLHKRDGFSLAKSSLIWLRHVVDAEYATRHVSRSVVDYDGIVTDWRTQVERIASELGTAWPKPLADVAADVDQFLSVQLRPHTATITELECSPHVVSWIQRAYAAMQAMARAGDHEAARREMDQVRSEFDNACLAFGAMWREEIATFAQETLTPLGVAPQGTLDRHVQRFEQQLASLDAAMREDLAIKVNGQHADLSRQLNQVVEASLRRDATFEELATKPAGHQAELERVIDAQARRITDLEVAVVASARQASEHATMARHVDVHDAKLSRLQCSLEGTITRLDALTARVPPSRSQSVVKRGMDRLKKAGRQCERVVRKVRKEVVRMVRLQSLQNYLARRRFRQTVRAIRTSGLFDAGWYLREYTDVAARGMNPVVHYLTYGVREGRCPNPFFHTRWYLEQYPDVRTAKAEPLLHYLHKGAAEGRDPSPLFQTAVWVARYPEIRGTKQNPLAHFIRSRGNSQRETSLMSGDAAMASVLPLAPPPITLASLGTSGWEPWPEVFPYAPLVSIIVPVYDTPPTLLEKMIDSVRRQAYGHWELCLVDDASPQPHVRPLLEQAAARDPRIRVTFRASNGNISAATNTGIALARGEFIAFLDHDDELTPDALLEVVRALNDEPDTDVIYTDQDKIDLEGRPSEPFYKPAWSPAYFQSVMYIGHLLVVRTSLLRETGGCDGSFDGVQDFELMLRLGGATKKIRHIPRILYHWRKIPGSIASDLAAKHGIVELQKKAVQAHLDRIGIAAIATTSGAAHRVRVIPAPRSREPLVSIMIPSKDHPELIGPCLASLFEKTTYKTFQVIVGDNETTDPEALRLFDRYPVTRVPLAGRFCFAAFNNRMAEQARGDYLLLLNNDTEVVQPNWLETLMLYAEQDDVGAVGPLLLYGDGTVQHAGVILGPRGTADHVMRGFPGDSDGYAGSLQAAREVTAVTGACLLVRRDHYMACGGLNETFGRHYEDVDFCLRLRKRGLRNIFVGGARMVHHESKSRGSYYDFTDRVLLLDHWESWIRRGDPYYNPAFDPERVDYSVRVA
jgi:O-antigen biosynthesis protein